MTNYFNSFIIEEEPLSTETQVSLRSMSEYLLKNGKGDEAEKILLLANDLEEFAEAIDNRLRPLLELVSATEQLAQGATE